MNAHRLVVQPIHDILKAEGHNCFWGQYFAPWGHVPGLDPSQVAFYVTADVGMTYEQKRLAFFSPHGLHPSERGHVDSYWRGFMAPGEWWISHVGEGQRSSGKYPVTGWPKFDVLFKLGAREKAVEEHGLGGLPYHRTVLYAPSGNWHWASSFDATIRHIVALFGGLAYNLIVKTGNYAQSFQEYAWLQESAKPGNVRVVDSEADVTPLYLLSDVVVTDGSSVAWEAIGLDKPTIQLTNMLDPASACCPGLSDCQACLVGGRGVGEKYKSYPECKACGGTIKTDLPGLRDTIMDAVENPGLYAVERRRWAKMVNDRVDGHAAERCVEAIRKLAGI